MAVEKSSGGGGFKRKRSGILGGGTPRFVTWILRIVFGVVLFLCLFGFINQAVTGQKFVDWFAQTGRNVGNTIVYIFTGEQETPVEVTDQGIYAQGYSPEGSKQINEVVKDNNKDNSKDNNNNSN